SMIRCLWQDTCPKVHFNSDVVLSGGCPTTQPNSYHEGTMPDSYQDTLKRVRPPRVRIDYKVETEGAEPILELPFVVGVMADLSAQSTQEKKGLKQRKFTPIDRDNFNDVMARAAPRVSFRVPNKLSDKPDEL